MNDGKTPFLGDRRAARGGAVQKAVGSAYRTMIRPPAKMSIKDGGLAGHERGLHEGQRRTAPYPANARQIMYAARRDILLLAEVENFGDTYFTQTILPDYVDAHPALCADWDVVYDAARPFRRAAHAARGADSARSRCALSRRAARRSDRRSSSAST